MIDQERKKYVGVGSLLLIFCLSIGFWYFQNDVIQSERVLSEDAYKLDPVKKKKARSDYFFNLLRDPATNAIPDNIRTKEVDHARGLPVKRATNAKANTSASQQIGDITWHMAGPKDLGGRTRALAIDQSNPNIILAGGVSGGMWKSTDGGNSWQMKTDPNQNLSVTSVAQDPSSTDTWYYASGEYYGNSTSARGSGGTYFGSGIYKSTDNGESWSLLPATDSDITSFDSQFDFISAIDVAPNGTLFAASNPFGLYRSQNGGDSFELVLGGMNEHYWTDFDIDADGNIIAVISSTSFSSQSNEPGIYYSTDNGSSWENITPSDFPTGHDRSVITFAPSDPNIVYAFSNKENSSTNQGVSFFKLNLSEDTAEDRSENIPDFGGSVGGMNLQGGYNMVVAVKPDDPDFVMVGGTNLFRSRDGFASQPTGGYDNSDSDQKDEYWIGGYAKSNNVRQYPNQHPDQHVVAFHPEDPDTMWVGHDGGLSVTTDLTADAITWENKNQGYVTGQFYTVAIPSAAEDTRLMGGTQDNGTPFFQFSNDNEQKADISDVSSGDGSYAFWGTDYAYVSSQNGRTLRLTVEDDGTINSPFNTPTGTYSDVYPSLATNKLFIHPYEIDPNDDTIMYYPGGTTMWRNTELDNIADYNSGGATTGWDDYEAVSSSGYSITTLEVTDENPSDRLYYGASSSDQPPKIFVVDNASSSEEYNEISIPNASSGAYMHDLAINPHNGDEVIAVMSNYSIKGLYHSTDAGQNWTAIEGNLNAESGPSLRNAEILPTEDGPIYMVGTSTGLYTTMSPNGMDTSWERASDGGGSESIGYSVVEYVTARPSDGTIAVGTHGRGIFVGRANVGKNQPEGPVVVDTTIDVDDRWQLIGSPMQSGEEVSVGSDIQLFEFNGSYRSAADMKPQTGYWAKSNAGSEITYSGEPSSTATITLQEGWNLIGGIADTIQVSAISDPNNILSAADIMEFSDGSYEAASNIKSMKGYWIHANEQGEIEISSSEGDDSSKQQPVLASGNINTLVFSNGNRGQRFFASSRSLTKKDREKYLMPPKAPAPHLDIRTTEGLRLAEGKQVVLRLTANSYPISVKENLDNDQNYLLKGVTGQDTVYYQFDENSELNIPREHQKLILEQAGTNDQVTEHNLLPNYPNPFNPATQIRYQVADPAHVTLEVYDVLGRKVQTLIDEPKESGSYQVRFDGSNLSSGMYFIHLSAGETEKLQKMTLIK